MCGDMAAVKSLLESLLKSVLKSLLCTLHFAVLTLRLEKKGEGAKAYQVP